MCAHYVHTSADIAAREWPTPALFHNYPDPPAIDLPQRSPSAHQSLRISHTRAYQNPWQNGPAEQTYRFPPVQAIAPPSASDFLERAMSNPDEIFSPSDPYGFHALNESGRDESTWYSWTRISYYSDQVVRQLYSLCLLKLPSMYFARVSRVFRRAGLSEKDVHKLEIEGIGTSQAIKDFEVYWAEFIDALLKEWKTLNVVSALLLSAILTLFQIDDAANQVVTRTTAFFSIVSAMMSLIFGCLFVIRFGTMKNRRKAAQFMEVIKRTKTSIWWNVLILLAIPAIWLSWSLIFFSAALMSFLWTSGSNKDNPTPPSQTVEFILRAFITASFLLGLIHLFLVVRDFGLPSTMNEYTSHQKPDIRPTRLPPPPRYAAVQGGTTVPILPLHQGRMPLDTGEGWEREPILFIPPAPAVIPATGYVPPPQRRPFT